MAKNTIDSIKEYIKECILEYYSLPSIAIDQLKSLLLRTLSIALLIIAKIIFSKNNTGTIEILSNSAKPEFNENAFLIIAVTIFIFFAASLAKWCVTKNKQKQYYQYFSTRVIDHAASLLLTGSSVLIILFFILMKYYCTIENQFTQQKIFVIFSLLISICLIHSILLKFLSEKVKEHKKNEDKINHYIYFSWFLPYPILWTFWSVIASCFNSYP